MRIMIADSYPDAADSTALLLGIWGHEPVVARSGPEAVKLAQGVAPEVALLELKLDELDGFQVAHRLPKETVLVAITGLADEVNRQRCLAEGFSHFLVKPVDPDELWIVLEQLRLSIRRCSCTRSNSNADVQFT